MERSLVTIVEMSELSSDLAWSLSLSMAAVKMPRG